MTLEELKGARAAAGARYCAAVEELRQAYVELGACDMILASSDPDLRTFHPHPQNIGDFQHPTFAAVDPAKCWREEVKARRDELLRGFGN